MQASLSVVVAGKKRVVLGSHTFDYDNKHFIVTSVDLPVTAWVTEASATNPYLGILLKIDLAAVRSLLTVVDQDKIGGRTPLGVSRADTTQDLLDPLFRLCRLSERPFELDLFAEHVEREVVYRLITSPIGQRLCMLASLERTSNGVIKALESLRQNFRQRQSADTLADIAGMGVSTLHRHFKALTAMSPVQYRKHMQLNEARRLMIMDGLDAATAAYDVGYDSPSQFSREYHRTFGQSPISSVANLRRSLQYDHVANQG